MSNLEIYNRENYINDMLNIVKSAKNDSDNELKVQLRGLLEKVEKDVSLLTYESNMATLKPASSFMVRI